MFVRVEPPLRLWTESLVLFKDSVPWLRLLLSSFSHGFEEARNGQTRKGGANRATPVSPRLHMCYFRLNSFTGRKDFQM